MEFKKCERHRGSCYCPEKVFSRGGQFALNRDHFVVAQFRFNRLPETDDSGRRKDKKLTGICNNPLHADAGLSLGRRYHFFIETKPAWYFDCVVPFNDDEKNRKVRILSEFFGLACCCRDRRRSRCSHCRSVQKRHKLTVKAFSADLSALLGIDSLLDWGKLEGSRCSFSPTDSETSEEDLENQSTSELV